MNYAIVFRLLGYILLCEGGLLCLPALVSALYGEWDVLWVFLFTVALCLIIGLILTCIKPRRDIIYMRESCVTAALTWVVISVMGAVPFVLSGAIPDPISALFETVSGFTTTGASVLADVESLPMGILFWRSFTHWIGGMGILVFLLAVMPLTGGSHVNLMKAESPGPQVEKMVPSVQATAKILYTIYLGMTILQILFMLAGGCPFMDTLLITFGTAGTGGFGVRNDSMASYSVYIQVVVTVFMILFGVNFSAYFYLTRRKFKKAFAIEEVRWYLLVIAAAIALVSWNIRGLFPNLLTAVQQAAFQVGSIITTTGFTTCNYDLWPPFAKGILVTLMFIGACAGSTGGGMKISRLVVLAKSIRKELQQTLHPNAVTPVRVDGKPIDHETFRSINVFMAAYIILFTVSVLLVSLDGQTMTTNFTAVAATFNNIGPGLEGVGPTQNFGALSILSKYTLMFDMLAGRLELFPLLLLFHPGVWKETFAKKIKETSAQYQ